MTTTAPILWGAAGRIAIYHAVSFRKRSPVDIDAQKPSKGGHLIAASRLFDGERMLPARLVEVADGRILALHAPGRAPADLPVVTLPEDAILAPGFIDLQVNGGGGALLNDAPGLETIRCIAAAHRRFGTTGLLPTLITDAPGRMTALAEVAEQALAIPGVLGFHLEGPFLDLHRKGIHPAEHVRRVRPSDIKALARFGRIGRSLVTLAPEHFQGEQLRTLAASGVRVSIGHSDATAAEVAAAVELGVSCVTHLYNAMSQMTPRAPGVVGAALADDRLHAGIICDGLHVDPLNLRVAYRIKGRERLMLVTDAMALVGAEAASFALHGRQISLRDGRLTDEDGTLAGAHLTMIDAVWNAVEMMGAPLEDALVMASRTPAAFLGLDEELGRIAAGCRADLVAFSGRTVLRSWIAGQAG